MRKKNIQEKKTESIRITRESNEKMNILQKLNNFSSSLILRIGIRIVYENARKQHNI